LDELAKKDAKTRRASCAYDLSGILLDVLMLQIAARFIPLNDRELEPTRLFENQ
jgi:hypothetical protein